MICPQCHSVNREGAKFCDECGCKLPDTSALESEKTGVLEPVKIAVPAVEVGADKAGSSQESPSVAGATPNEEPSQSESASEPSQQSRVLDRVHLPEIDVPGINVYEDGNPYDDEFSEQDIIEDEAAHQDDVSENDSESRDMASQSSEKEGTFHQIDDSGFDVLVSEIDPHMLSRPDLVAPATQGEAADARVDEAADEHAEDEAPEASDDAAASTEPDGEQAYEPQEPPLTEGSYDDECATSEQDALESDDEAPSVESDEGERDSADAAAEEDDLASSDPELNASAEEAPEADAPASSPADEDDAAEVCDAADADEHDDVASNEVLDEDAGDEEDASSEASERDVPAADEDDVAQVAAEADDANDADTPNADGEDDAAAEPQAGDSDEPDSADVDPFEGAPEEDAERAMAYGQSVERLVGSDYVKPPRQSWRSGDTMKIPSVDEEPEKKRDFRAPDEKHSRGVAKPLVAALITLVVLGGGAAAATYHMELWGGKTVPDVVGMTQTDAQFLLQSKGFAVRSTTVQSDETEGLVLLMDPGAHARQDEGTEVVIHVAQARTIPDVIGSSRDDAAAAFDADGYANVTYTEELSDSPADTVLAVSPEPGTKAKAGDAVTVTVAAPRVVPAVAGMTWQQAKTAIEELGLAAKSANVYDDTVTEGTLTGTDPAPGTELKAGQTVTVYIAKSRGSELIAAARSYLSSVGSLAVNGGTFNIQSVDAVAYAGNDTTTFTVTGQGVATASVLGETVTVPGSVRTVTGAITWDSSNQPTAVSVA